MLAYSAWRLSSATAPRSPARSSPPRWREAFWSSSNPSDGSNRAVFHDDELPDSQRDLFFLGDGGKPELNVRALSPQSCVLSRKSCPA